MGTLHPYHRMVKTAQFWKTGKPAVTAPKKATRFYPAEDVKTKLASNHHNTSKQTKLRASITPGTVVILLAGHHKGKRVVFLKQLDSGLLLVTGPYKVNGVPLRRVPQSYVIATQTQVNISKVKVPDTVNDAMFKKPKTPKKKKDDELFFEKKEDSSIDESRKATQQQVDSALVAEISKTPLLKAYIASKFFLKKGQKPHEMTF